MFAPGFNPRMAMTMGEPVPTIDTLYVPELTFEGSATLCAVSVIAPVAPETPFIEYWTFTAEVDPCPSCGVVPLGVVQLAAPIHETVHANVSVPLAPAF